MPKPVILIWECARCPAVVAQSYPMSEGLVSVNNAFPPEPFTYVRDPHVHETVYVLCPTHYKEWRQHLEVEQASGDTIDIAVSEDLGLEERAP